MYHEFILELKSMRQKSGLSQEDCAHLIGSSPTIYGRIERGDRPPSVEEICCLQLLFGKTFESFYATCVGDAGDGLRRNLQSMPKLPGEDCDQLAREVFLRGLSSRLHTKQNRNDR